MVEANENLIEFEGDEATLSQLTFTEAVGENKDLRMFEVGKEDSYYSKAATAFFRELGVDNILVYGTDFAPGSAERTTLKIFFKEI